MHLTALLWGYSCSAIVPDTMTTYKKQTYFTLYEIIAETQPIQLKRLCNRFSLPMEYHHMIHFSLSALHSEF